MANYSRQRETILSYLKSVTSHPTAENVYEHVRTTLPKISLGTVYRNLNELSSAGVIQKLSCGESFERFDGNPNPHYHFICNCCRSVSDLPIESLAHIDRIAAAGFSGKIDGHIVYFFGICNTCLKPTDSDNSD